jgi:hypothetical protein
MTAIQVLLYRQWKKIETDLSSEFSVIVYSKDREYNNSHNIKTNNIYEDNKNYISKYNKFNKKEL